MGLIEPQSTLAGGGYFAILNPVLPVLRQTGRRVHISPVQHFASDLSRPVEAEQARWSRQKLVSCRPVRAVTFYSKIQTTA